MTRMSDVDFLRWIAALPPSQHQPLYEAARLNEIADKLDEALGTAFDCKEALATVSAFFAQHSDEIGPIMDRAPEEAEKMLYALKTAIARHPEPLPVKDVEMSFLPDSGTGRISLQRGGFALVRHESPESVDSDTTTMGDLRDVHTIEAVRSDPGDPDPAMVEARSLEPARERFRINGADATQIEFFSAVHQMRSAKHEYRIAYADGCAELTEQTPRASRVEDDGPRAVQEQENGGQERAAPTLVAPTPVETAPAEQAPNTQDPPAPQVEPEVVAFTRRLHEAYCDTLRVQAPNEAQALLPWESLALPQQQVYYAIARTVLSAITQSRLAVRLTVPDMPMDVLG